MSGSTIPLDYGVVLGCPRSGTTFLIDCLQAMPRTLCISGHHLPVPVPHILNQPLAPEHRSALAYGFRESLENYVETGDLTRLRAIYGWFRRYTSTGEMVSILRRNQPPERVVYKEPFLAFSPEFCMEALPGCRIVHIVRDGRDAADSMVRSYDVLTDEKLTTLETNEAPLGRRHDERYVPWWVEPGEDERFLSSSPWLRAVWAWREMVGRCRTFAESSAADGRYFVIRYEDLVSDPDRFGEAVVRHLGGESNARLKARFRGASMRSVGIHRRRKPEEIEMATAIAETELRAYGYV